MGVDLAGLRVSATLRGLAHRHSELGALVIASDPGGRIAGAVLTMGLVAISLWLSQRLAPRSEPGGTLAGVAAVPGWVGWLGPASAGLMVGFGIAVGLTALAPDRQLAAAVMIILGGLVGWLANPDRLWSLRVTWRLEGLEGAGRIFASVLRGPREVITWPELTCIGGLDGGVWFVEAVDGRRVYWSDLHEGRARLLSAIQLRRPDLFGPAVGAFGGRTRVSGND